MMQFYSCCGQQVRLLLFKRSSGEKEVFLLVSSVIHDYVPNISEIDS